MIKLMDLVQESVEEARRDYEVKCADCKKKYSPERPMKPGKCPKCGSTKTTGPSKGAAALSRAFSENTGGDNSD